MSAKKTPPMSNSLAAGIISLSAKATLRNDTLNKSSHGKPAGLPWDQVSRCGSHVTHSNGPPSCSGSVSVKATTRQQQQQIVMGADYEIKITKQYSKSTEIKVSGPKSIQNNQSRGVNNTSHPNQQIGNQKRSDGNQNQQGNQNKPNANQNKSIGQQNKPSGNQNAPGKVQGHQNQKHGNLTSGKNNPGGRRR